MRRKSDLPELLAPAGDMICLYAAVSGGADAIYVGGQSFGARAYAKNFDIAELAQAVSYCHLRGVKLYVTVNTLVYDKELQEVSDYVAELWRIGVDAVITADIGVIQQIRCRVPKMPIHASTQMSVHNTYGADMACELGCERVVLARELSLENISSVTDNCRIETEIFLHGALCVCHSGQCLMSSLVGGRSGNRGECAQPCRLPYSNKYPLSLKDLSLAAHITQIIDTGVASLKIEGRMKSPDYVYTVTSVYRRLLDERRNATSEENEVLRKIFSRGGFTDGYFVGKKFNKMTGVRSADDKEQSKKIAGREYKMEKTPVSAEACIKIGEPAKLTLKLPYRSVTVYGAAATAAISSPLTENGVKERLSKMGATMLSLDIADIKVELDSGANLSPSAINALRRDAASALVFAEREASKSSFEPQNFARMPGKPLKTAVFLNTDSFACLMEKNNSLFDAFDAVFLPVESFVSGASGVYIPPVITDEEMPCVSKLVEKAREQGAKYALVGNIGHIALVRKYDLIPIGDFRLNITNSCAMDVYSSLGILNAVVSPELTLPMARDIGGGEIVYGKIPLMLTERCFIKENFGCASCGKAALKDRTGASFALIREFGHRNLILNSLPTYMGDRKKELNSAKIIHEHFIFTNESASETEKIINAYLCGASLNTDVRRIGKRQIKG